MTQPPLYGYRLVKKKWAASAFDGEGAKRYGGRWNGRGRRCVYLASSESLAILEVMVHLDDYRLLDHYALFRVELTNISLMRLSEKALPSNWREDPAPPETAAIGDEWLQSKSSLALAIPSVIVPRELNYMLNPGRPDYEALARSATQISFEPDPRLAGW